MGIRYCSVAAPIRDGPAQFGDGEDGRSRSRTGRIDRSLSTVEVFGGESHDLLAVVAAAVGMRGRCGAPVAMRLGRRTLGRLRDAAGRPFVSGDVIG